MANHGHIKILTQGVHVWNSWRHNRSFISPDLSGADLTNRNLAGINFSNTNLDDADFTNTNLTGANLIGASLEGTRGLGKERSSKETARHAEVTPGPHKRTRGGSRSDDATHGY